jgi:hypothetical protein
LKKRENRDDIDFLQMNGKSSAFRSFRYGKRSINLNKVVATFEKHIFLSQTDLTRTGIISNRFTPQIAKYGIDIQIVRPEMMKFKMFREKVTMDFYFVGITF